MPKTDNLINMNVVIRQEVKVDFSDIYYINKIAFGQDMEAKLVDLLRNSNAFIPQLSLVALVGNKTVAHILFTRIKIIDNKNEFDSLARAPMAVRPELQKQGIVTQLIQHGLNKAKEIGYKSVIRVVATR